jgi:DNA polymerase-1
MTTLVAIDGTNLIYRAYHALESTERGTASGDENWVVAGFIDTVARMIQMHRPTSLVIALDGIGGCPSRRLLAPEYKAGRAETPQFLIEQLMAAGVIFTEMGVAWREVYEWEADDVLATLATMANARGARAVVVSSDKDAHQLVGGQIVVYKPEGKLINNAALESKYGVKGDRWVEFAAMVGEKSDNLPGVMGVGPKRAAQVIEAFSDVEEAFSDPDKARALLGDRLAGMLLGGVEAFRRNRLVGTLRRDLDISTDGIQLTHLSATRIEAAGEARGMGRPARNLATAVSRMLSVQTLV